MKRPLALGSTLLAVLLLVQSTATAQKDTAQKDTAQKDAAKENTATTPVPRDKNWMKRHDSISEKAKKGDIDLIFIGDSITQGWEGAGKAVWAKYYAPRKALNVGISGDRTEHVLWRLDHGNIDNIKPKLAVIMIGTNNSGSNTPAEIAAGIKLIVEKLRTKLPEMKILLLGVFPRGEKPTDHGRIVNAKVNEIIAKLADDKMVYYQDIGAKFLGPDGVMSKETMHDFLHPGAAGYETWAEAIEPKVKELMGEK
jgi:beta-glucosidase